MSLNARPIFSALLRNRTGAVLVAMQIALALAVLVNAIYIVSERVQKIHRPTGIDSDNIVVVSTAGFTGHYQEKPAIDEDLNYLRGVNGVVAASVMGGLPLSDGGNNNNLVTRPDARRNESFNSWEIDDATLDALGLHLVAGRNFRHDEILPALTKSEASRFVPQIIVSRALAEHLFPGQNPLGQRVYDSLNQTATIIGVVDPIIGSFPSFPHPDYVYMMPRYPAEFLGGPGYMVRTRPGMRDTVARLIEAHLSQSNPDRVINYVRPLNYFKNLSYLHDTAMNRYLITVTTLVVGVTCLGIFALATFNVSTRTKQIGTRRAVGARRSDIVNYFLVENGLITSAGVVVGCALALATGYALSLLYGLPRLNLYYLVAGVLALWALSQLAAWQPARRAAGISPAVATRTV
jgi:putative ABC transport system permease protein